MGILRLLTPIMAPLLLCCSSPDAETVVLPPASALWAWSYPSDDNTANFQPWAAQTQVSSDGATVAVVGDVFGITDGGLSSGLVALLDATTGAPLFEQTIVAQPKGGYALVDALTAAVVPDGVLVAGYVAGTLTLGTAVGDGPYRYNGAFLAKFDRAGAVVWAKFPGTGSIAQVRADATGNAYVVGSIDDQFDFGAGAFPSSSELGTGMTHLYIAKLDPSGTQLFANAYAVTSAGLDARGSSRVQGLVVDSTGNATWFGSFEGAVDLGSGPMASPNPDNDPPGLEVFLAHTSAAGDVASASSLGTTAIHALTLDPTGAPVLVGDCSEPVNFGRGSVPCTPEDLFVAKVGDAPTAFFDEISPATRVDYSDTSGVSPVTQSRAGAVDLIGVAVDANGNAFVAGELAGDLTIGDASVHWTSGISANASFNDWTPDALLAGFDPSGHPFVAEGFGDSNYQVAESVAVDPAGHVFAAGWFGGTATFGPNVAVRAQQTCDLFVAAFAP